MQSNNNKKKNKIKIVFAHDNTLEDAFLSLLKVTNVEHIFPTPILSILGIIELSLGCVHIRKESSAERNLYPPKAVNKQARLTHWIY